MKQVSTVAYELDLPLEMEMVYLIFHMSILRKFMGNSNSIVPVEGMGIEENFAYEEVLVEILDLQVKRLRNKKFVSIKVLSRI